ncbi:3-hydroxyacyl-CoA dehydrogenase NAD-binding domain-containing protein [Croceicoccus sp. F390]|uniref:3-hydroxyacyl-CoA dehydrogenase NAD-binding domain-containing protein n=1 Tax=Croceicoccus esteveae TaxID=3075597 RepID=A0ABU2ZI28_9SPHN|nr:FAD-dependent oxidoreductase [Croceicoccus sp. F390]MDT0576016.1 3-hydroxyacyl-CoA dehydrogenase NAD-binding domain-containing protein [Croceicoccus sp. F390]
MNEAVTTTTDADGIRVITMDLPGEKMNTLGPALTDPLEAALHAAMDDEAVKGIVLTSAKDSFVAGGDLKQIGGGGYGLGDMTPAEVVHLFSYLSRLLRWMETAGKPVACAINGMALGGGLEIALACHYRVVADDPRIQLGLPESMVGLMPGGGGTQRLPRLIGLREALPLIMQGKSIAPQQALKLGMVDAVVPASELIDAAKDWLRDKGDPVQPWDRKGFKVPGGAGTLDADFRNTIMISTVMTQGSSFGNYPAPQKILAALYEGLQLPMDKALGVEAKYLAQLMLDPVAGNLIRTMFINKGKADKLAARPADVPKQQFTRIAVVGAGTMGAGIAFAAARAGIEVVLIDRDMAAAQKGKAYAQKRLARDVEKGRADTAKMERVLARIHPADNYDDIGDVQLAIESVFEDRHVKRDVIARLSAALPAGVPIGSNTSGLPITSLADYSDRPERFIGLHFFSPADRMPLVEIIRGERTDAACWAQALDFVQALRKTPITVNDGPGFFTSRFIGSFISASLQMLDEGITPALIENGARMVGMPMGALAISDAIGLDVSYHAGHAQAKERGEEPTLGVIGQLYEAGRHGMKNGKGFFDYDEHGGKRLWAGLGELLPTLDAQPTIEEVKQRILYAQLAEGARCFAQGVLPDVIDGDLGATLGVGFPAYLGGPFAAMDTIGIAKVVATCDRLHEAYGALYVLPAIVRDMARDGRTFHGPDAASSPGQLQAA